MNNIEGLGPAGAPPPPEGAENVQQVSIEIDPNLQTQNQEIVEQYSEEVKSAVQQIEEKSAGELTDEKLQEMRFKVDAKAEKIAHKRVKLTKEVGEKGVETLHKGMHFSAQGLRMLNKLERLVRHLHAGTRLLTLALGSLGIVSALSTDRTLKKQQASMKEKPPLPPVTRRTIDRIKQAVSEGKPFGEIQQSLKEKEAVDLEQVGIKSLSQLKKALKNETEFSDKVLGKQIPTFSKAKDFLVEIMNLPEEVSDEETVEMVKEKLGSLVDTDTLNTKEKLQNAIRGNFLSSSVLLSHHRLQNAVRGNSLVAELEKSYQPPLQTLINQRKEANQPRKEALRKGFEKKLDSMATEIRERWEAGTAEIENQIESEEEQNKLTGELYSHLAKEIYDELHITVDESTVAKFDQEVKNPKVLERLLDEHVGHADALAASTRNGLKALSEAKQKIERDFFKFEKRQSLIATPLAILSSALYMAGEVLAATGIYSLPGLAMMAFGYLTMTADWGLAAIGLAHTNRNKPNTLREKVANLRTLRMGARKIPYKFYRALMESKKRHKELNEYKQRLVQARLITLKPTEAFRNELATQKHRFESGIYKILQKEELLKQEDMEKLINKDAYYTRKIEKLSGDLKKRESAYYRAAQKLEPHREALYRAEFADTARKLTPLELLEGAGKGPTLAEALYELQKTGNNGLDEETKKTLFKTTGLTLEKLNEEVETLNKGAGTEEFDLKEMIGKNLIKFFGGSPRAMAKYGQKVQKSSTS